MERYRISNTTKLYVKGMLQEVEYSDEEFSNIYDQPIEPRYWILCLCKSTTTGEQKWLVMDSNDGYNDLWLEWDFEKHCPIPRDIPFDIDHPSFYPKCDEIMNINELKNVKNIEAFEGSFAVFNTTSNKIGIINRQGEIILKPSIYDEAICIKDGLYLLDKYDGNTPRKLFNAFQDKIIPKHIIQYGNICIYKENELMGLCSQDFQTLIFPQYNIIVPWNNNYLAKKDKHWGLITTNNEELLPFEYDDIVFLYGNKDSTILCVTKNGKYFYINQSGERISNRTYEYLEPYTQAGYAIMKQNGFIGIIDKNENIVYKSSFSEISDGISRYSRFYWCTPEHIAFYDNGLWGIMNFRGEIIYTPQYKHISWLTEGSYLIKVENTEGFFGTIDLANLCGISCEYKQIYPMRKFNVIVACNNQNKYGIMDIAGNILIPFEYDCINISKHYGLKEIAVIKNNKQYFINEKQERINIF